MATFDLRPWLTCIDTTFGGDDAGAPTVDAADLDVHHEEHREVLIRAQHPTLAAAIDEGVEELVVHDEPMNPRLHLLVHEIVANQLVDGEPAAVRATALRLEREAHDRHEILHMIAGGVSRQLWSALDEGSPADLDAYVAYLEGLPASWYDADEDDATELLDDDGFDMLGPAEDDDGPAALLVRAMLDDGVDLLDEAAVGAWIEDFNAGPSAERDRVLGPALGSVTLPPLALPDDATLATSALASRAAVQLARFVTWLGDRRPLTDQGNLKLADGKHLVELLGTGDRYDQTVRGRTFRTQSTTRLLGVDLVHRLALASGLTRRQGGSLRRTRVGAELAAVAARAGAGATTADRPPQSDARTEDAFRVEPDDADTVLERWRTIVHEMIDLGLVAGGREDRYGARWWADTLDDGVVELLSSMLVAGAPMSVDRLVDDALEQLGEDYALDELSEWVRDGLPDFVAWGMGQLADRLVWLGLVSRDDVRVELDVIGEERRLGGSLALTPLGMWFVRPLVIAQGFDVPLAGALAGADVDELLDAVAGWTPAAFAAEVDRWSTDRPMAADELADAVRAASGFDRVGVAFEALELLGADAEPAVRRLADDPRHLPFVIAWLRDGGFDPLPGEPGDPRLELVRSVASVLVTIGPEAATEAALADRADAALVEQLWRVDDPWTTPVLEALGAGSDKRLAKAARRALFKRRNRN